MDCLLVGLADRKLVVTTGPSACLVLQGEAKRGNINVALEAPPQGGGEVSADRQGFFTREQKGNV